MGDGGWVDEDEFIPNNTKQNNLAAVWRTQRLTLRQYVTIANGGKAVREEARLDFYYLTNEYLVSFIYLIASDIE